MIQHAVKEATRLGITINMNNDGGYSGSGGPWITPELSMQMLTWSETTLEGARPFAGTLTQPKTVKNYYQDIAVLAFPTPAGETVRMAEHAPRITYGVEPRNFDAANLLDGNPATAAIVPLAGTSLTQYLNIDFPEPLTAQSLTVALDIWNTADPRGARGFRRRPALRNGARVHRALAGVFRELSPGDGAPFPDSIHHSRPRG